jgi:hypothetical protein
MNESTKLDEVKGIQKEFVAKKKERDEMLARIPKLEDEADATFGQPLVVRGTDKVDLLEVEGGYEAAAGGKFEEVKELLQKLTIAKCFARFYGEDMEKLREKHRVAVKEYLDSLSKEYHAAALAKEEEAVKLGKEAKALGFEAEAFTKDPLLTATVVESLEKEDVVVDLDKI